MAKIITRDEEVRRQTRIAQIIASRSGTSPIVGPTSLVDLTANITSVSSGANQSIAGTASTVQAGVSGIIRSASLAVANTSIYNPQLGNYLKPVSSHIGSVLGTLTGILASPLGSLALLPRALADLIERINPGFAAKMEATFLKYKIQALANLPGQILGSIRNLITLADAILTLPVIIIADLYQALMDLMQEIAKFVDELMSWIYNFFFGPQGILNTLIPIAEILALLEEVSALAGEIGGIATLFLGANPIAGFTNTIQTYTSQLGSFIANPFDALFAYAPPQVSQALYLIRNPQQMINSLLPPQLSQLFRQVSAATGFGFNGNMGYGFASVLQGLRGGVLSSILSNFSAQYPILTPLIGGLGLTNTLGGATGGAASLFTNPFGQKTTAGGIVQPQVIPPPVIPAGTTYNYAGGSAVSTGNISPAQAQAAIRSAQAAAQQQGICWIAREVYGVNNPNWMLFRMWLLTRAPEWLLINYINHGEQIAKWISNKPLIKLIIRTLMNLIINTHKKYLYL